MTVRFAKLVTWRSLPLLLALLATASTLLVWGVMNRRDRVTVAHLVRVEREKRPGQVSSWGRGDESLVQDQDLVLVGGMGLALLLPVMTLLAQAAHRRAGEVETANRKLTESKERYRELEENTSDIIHGLEEKFRQAQKMEAVGRLAGGIAHDFNNLLTVITGCGDVVVGSLAEDNPSRQLVQEIVKAGNRAAALTRQLLAFSRKQILSPLVLDLNSVVSDTQRLLERLIGEDITLVTLLEPDLHRVRADPGQLEQVILNLAINARDAMPHGGALTLETGNVEVDEAYAQAHPEFPPGDYVTLVMRDTGCGMDPETLSHVFEPFFTTKEIGKGTGLGLAMVYGIIKQSGGQIEVSSTVGSGTALRIYLPRVHEELAAQFPISPLSITAGNETILLVEDEQSVRSLARLILETNGYRVLEAQNGREALRICEHYAGTIDLVVTDVIMPQMSGRQLVEQLAPLRPAARVLYLSGYTDEALGREGFLNQGMAFLQKPFTQEMLLQKIREVLAAPVSEPVRRRERSLAPKGRSPYVH